MISSHESCVIHVVKFFYLPLPSHLFAFNKQWDVYKCKYLKS